MLRQPIDSLQGSHMEVVLPLISTARLLKAFGASLLLMDKRQIQWRVHLKLLRVHEQWLWMWLDSSIRIPELGTIVFTQLLIFDSNVPQLGRMICAFTMQLFSFIFLTTAISEEWGLGRLWYTALWRHHRSWRCVGGEWGWVEVCWKCTGGVCFCFLCWS